MNLPDGTITFLFTDIVGSTQLWEQNPEAMRTCLSCHDALLKSAIESSRGVVFKTVGDAFCAAFASASDAVAAALSGQLNLLTEPWQDTLCLRVRMALHTGTAELRDNDYFGRTLNRTARLLAIGHGGQILLSEATQALVKNREPAGAALTAMGEHRLKDLQQPERVFQLVHPDLLQSFPPLRSLNNLQHNLPLQTTSFIGRDKEFAEIKALLAGTRLLTLTGSGGAGKTRLSLQVAADLIGSDNEEVCLVELAPLSDAALVVQTVASALEIREESGQTMLQTLVVSLRSKKLLLILDNCEHVLDAIAQFADTILKNCPDIKILASSRESLGIPGEQTYRVPSLKTPPALQATQSLPLETVSAYEAVLLFADRTALVKPDFAVTDANASVLCRLCNRLDGIPLALELAAARVRALPLEQIEFRLNDRFRLLTGGSRTALPRQQTLRALIDWSYDLLGEQERTLLRRLAVFAGGWTLEAAESVGASGEIAEWEVLDVLTALVDKSLVLYEEQEGQARYRLLETVRQYALERLKEAEEEAPTRSRHLSFFLQWAERIETKLHGPEQLFWLAQLEDEHDNLRAGLEWSLIQPESEESGLRMVGALYWFWQMHSHLSEGRKWLKALLVQTANSGRTSARAKALQGAGQLAFYDNDSLEGVNLLEECGRLWQELGDKQGFAHSLVYFAATLFWLPDERMRAYTLLKESVALAREVGDKWNLAMSLWMYGTTSHVGGDDALALPLLKESVGLFQNVGDAWGLTGPLIYLAEIMNTQGDYESARSLMEQALSTVRLMGDKWRISAILDTLGEIAIAEGNYQEAYALCEESLAMCRGMSNNSRIPYKYRNMGYVARLMGNYAEAHRFYSESLNLDITLGNRERILNALDGIARLAAAEGQSLRAARLFGFIARQRETFHAVILGHEKIDYEHSIMAAKSILSEQEFAAAWAAGESMTLDDAIGMAQEGADNDAASVG